MSWKSTTTTISLNKWVFYLIVPRHIFLGLFQYNTVSYKVLNSFFFEKCCSKLQKDGILPYINLIWVGLPMTAKNVLTDLSNRLHLRKGICVCSVKQHHQLIIYVSNYFLTLNFIAIDHIELYSTKAWNIY